MASLNQDVIGRTPINLPDPATQAEIASILSAYDDLIENNRRRIQLLEQAARLLYKEWFVHLRFPGHEHVTITDGVPEGWEKVPLSELCTDVRESANPKDLPHDTAYIGLEHIPRRSITLNDWGMSSEVNSNKFKFAEGDILFGKIRPYFHKVGFALIDGIASSDAIVIRPTDSHLYHYVLFLLSSDEFVALASKTVREGSKMPRADWKFLHKSEFKRPSETRLGMFNDAVKPICTQLRNLALHSQQLTQARDLLLPRLMNGEVVV
jgi:type I restriction enzyme S subunit